MSIYLLHINYITENAKISKKTEENFDICCELYRNYMEMRTENIHKNHKQTEITQDFVTKPSVLACVLCQVISSQQDPLRVF